jgi:DNA-binding ferritin-like protein
MSSVKFEKTLFEFFLGFVGQVKLFHWTTMTYSIHKALDDLHSSLSENVDKLIEVYIGRFDKQPIEKITINMTAETDTSNLITYLENQRENIKKMRNTAFKSCSEIQSIMDEMMGSINTAIYLCKLK